VKVISQNEKRGVNLMQSMDDLYPKALAINGLTSGMKLAILF
jgi:hypothetical protein